MYDNMDLGGDERTHISEVHNMLKPNSEFHSWIFVRCDFIFGYPQSVYFFW